MRVTLFDYGAGNLHSLAKALSEAADEVRVEPDPIRSLETDVLVLPGVGAFASAVERLEPVRGRGAARALAQAGWASRPEALLERAPLDFVYYAHSFACRPADEGVVIAWSTHESDRFAAAIRRRNVLGLQFHPEKSSRAGVRLLGAFLDQVRPAPPRSATMPLGCRDPEPAAPSHAVSRAAARLDPGAMPCW